MTNTVDISGLDKAAVLQALHAAARRTREDCPVTPITTEHARELLRWRYSVDFVLGRWVCCNQGPIAGCDCERCLSGFDAALYDQKNGPGAAQVAIDHLRRELSLGSRVWGTGQGDRQ